MRPIKKFSKRPLRKPWFKKPLFLILLSLLLLAAGVITVLEMTDTTTWFHKKNFVTQPVTADRTVGPETKGEGGQKDEPTRSDSPKEDDAAEETPPTVELKAPYGNFVSNHHPSISGQSSPNEIQSVCITTPGATCTIVFIKNNERRELPPQKTDAEGAAYWTWKLHDIGLTEGNWKIQGKATLGSQVKTADDILVLEVKP